MSALTADLSDEFFAELARMGRRHRTDPAFYLLVWALESDLNPHIVNSIGARGLNQMLPSTLAWLHAPADFEKLPAEGQLPWIENLIAYGEGIIGGPFESAARYYHSNFYPGTLRRGSSPETVVVARDAADGRERAAYAANVGLDANGDGRTTLADLAAVLERMEQRAKTQEALERLDAAVATTQRSKRDMPPARRVAVGLALVLSVAGLIAWRTT